MPVLFAQIAAQLEVVGVLLSIFAVFIVDLLIRVLLEATALRVDLRLATAPPHRAAPFGAMRAAGPIEIVSLVVLFLAVDAVLLVRVVVAALA